MYFMFNKYKLSLAKNQAGRNAGFSHLSQALKENREKEKIERER